MTYRYWLLSVVSTFLYVSMLISYNAGILPYCYIKGQLHFLLGKEPRGFWNDFGGKSDPGEVDPIETAVREATEETRYVFGKYAGKKSDLTAPIKKRKLATYGKKSALYLKTRITHRVEHPKGCYTMFLAKVDYIPASIFNDAYKTPHFDKTHYEWVSAQELMHVARTSSARNVTFLKDKKLMPNFVDELNVPAWQNILKELKV